MKHMKEILKLIRQVALFYINGFRGMTLGKVLWGIIIVKLLIMFAILRPFFFQPTLKGSPENKAQAVEEKLIQTIRPIDN